MLCAEDSREGGGEEGEENAVFHLNKLEELAETLNARYSESLGVVLVHMGRRLVIFFASGKVTIRVNDIEEGKKLINSMLAMSAQKQILMR